MVILPCVQQWLFSLCATVVIPSCVQQWLFPPVLNVGYSPCAQRGLFSLCTTVVILPVHNGELLLCPWWVFLPLPVVGVPPLPVVGVPPSARGGYSREVYP